MHAVLFVVQVLSAATNFLHPDWQDICLSTLLDALH